MILRIITPLEIAATTKEKHQITIEILVMTEAKNQQETIEIETTTWVEDQQIPLIENMKTDPTMKNIVPTSTPEDILAPLEMISITANQPEDFLAPVEMISTTENHPEDLLAPVEIINITANQPETLAKITKI